MLPKRSRLSAAEVRAILKGGRSARAEGLSVKFLKAPRPGVAVVVSKKVAKSAVLRNRLRRAAYRVLQKTALPRVHAVLFLHSTTLNPDALTALCSQLS